MPAPWRELAEMNAVALSLLLFFEYLGLMVPNLGWIMYFFAMPVCWAFAEIDSPWLGYPLLAVHLIAFPILKRSARFQNVDPGRRLGDQLSAIAWDFMTPRIFFEDPGRNRTIFKAIWEALTRTKPPDPEAPP